MRVVAGSARGRLLRAPAGRATRPTSDRVREAMFSMLTSMGAVEEGHVLDLFAGSGALGVEALSRGAAHVTFVDNDRAALEVVRANLETVGAGDRQATVVRADALAYAASAGDADICFADPPYSFTAWPALLERLASSGFTGIAVLEAGAEIDLGSGWLARRARRYGGTVVHVAQPLSAEAHRPPVS